jgi:hypothetical protein
MTASDRFVADTNVLVSFVLRSNSTPGRAVTTALLDHLMVFSATTYAELDQVLMRSKFDRYVSRRREGLRSGCFAMPPFMSIPASRSGHAPILATTEFWKLRWLARRS